MKNWYFLRIDHQIKFEYTQFGISIPTPLSLTLTAAARAAGVNLCMMRRRRRRDRGSSIEFLYRVVIRHTVKPIEKKVACRRLHNKLLLVIRISLTHLDHGTFGAAHHDVPVERRDDPVRGPRHEREHFDVRVDLEAGDLEDHGHGEDDADRDDVEVAEFLGKRKIEQLLLSVRSKCRGSNNLVVTG